MINQDGVLIDDQMTPAMIPGVAAQMPRFSQPPMGLPDPPAAKPPKIPADVGSRQDLYRNLLGDFMWSLASSAEAGAKAAPGQRNTAAFAGALRGPYNRRKAEQDLQFSQAREMETQAQAQRAMATIDSYKSQAEVNAQKADTAHEQVMSMIGINQARVDLLNAQTETERKTLQSKIDELTSRITKNNIVSVPGVGLFDIGQSKVIEGTEPTNEIDVTPELAQAVFANPAAAQAIIGTKQKLSDLTPYLKPRTALAITADAVKVVNMDDGSVVSEVGKPRPVTVPGQMTPTALMGQENTLRDDYRQEVTPLLAQKSAYDFITTMRDKPTGGPNDIVLIYNFVKLQDPNAVREGEIETVQKGASIPDTWRRYIGQYMNGNVLGPGQREKMIVAADNLYKQGIRPKIMEANARYKAQAERQGLDWRNMQIRELEDEPKTPTGNADYKSLADKMRGRAK